MSAFRLHWATPASNKALNTVVGLAGDDGLDGRIRTPLLLSTVSRMNKRQQQQRQQQQQQQRRRRRPWWCRQFCLTLDIVENNSWNETLTALVLVDPVVAKAGRKGEEEVPSVADQGKKSIGERKEEKLTSGTACKRGRLRRCVD
ncbi:conserved hypothetical protein [Trichinella spiralis]|uniref:hypothetical protein n=1 Tax=Trichinella spiralis TaxID=6334 RepID=UPI0001EFE70A|nr:conserved hypothetical protein [Trichinella spiralis]